MRSIERPGNKNKTFAKQKNKKAIAAFPIRSFGLQLCWLRLPWRVWVGAIALASLGGGKRSQASEVYLQIYSVSTSGVAIRSVDTRAIRRARPGAKIRLHQDTLVLAPENKAWATLQLVKDGDVQNDYAGLVLKTVPRWQGASFTFPCTLSGKFHITWRPFLSGGRLQGKLAAGEAWIVGEPRLEWLFVAISLLTDTAHLQKCLKPCSLTRAGFSAFWWVISIVKTRGAT